MMVLGVMLVGCADKAEPEFKECERLQNQGRIEDAIEACGTAASRSPASDYGIKAIRKIDELQAKLDSTIPPSVSVAWCARLSARLLPILTSGAKAASPEMNAAWVENSVREHVQNMEYNCRQDSGKPTAGEWECRWNETFATAKACDQLRVR